MDSMITPKDLKELISIAREQTGWTYKELGQRAGINSSTLAYYARMDSFPKNPEQIVKQIQKVLSEETKRTRAANY